MKKIISIVMALLICISTVVFAFAGCSSADNNKTDKTTSAVDLVNSQSIDKVLSSDEKWNITNFLPEGFEETKVLGESSEQKVYESVANVSYETVSEFYTNLAKEKSASVETDGDFTIFQWQEDNVEVYIKASKVSDKQTIITVDYYNGSIND